MQLQSIKNLSSLEEIKTLTGYTPINKVTFLNIPHSPELRLLIANLAYQAKRILDKEIYCKNGLSATMYLYKAIEVMNIIDDYQNKHISYKELRGIKKEFGLNELYK